MSVTGHALRLGKHFLEGVALADDPPVVVLQNDLLAKIEVLPFEAGSELLVLGKCGPKRLVGPLAQQGIGKDLPDHLQAGDDFRGPLATPLEESEGDAAQDRAAAP